MIKENKNRLNVSIEHLDDAPIGVVTAGGKQLTIEYANKSAIALLQLPQQYLGASLFDILPELFLKTIVDDIHKTCFDQRKNLSISSQEIGPVIARDRDPAWCDISIQPLIASTGITEGLVLYFSDVSAQVQASRSIALHENYLTNFFRQAPVALVLYRGEDFVVDLANDKALEIWGKSLGDVKGKSIVKIFLEVETDPVIKARHTESLERLKRNETHVVNEVELTFIRNGLPHTGWYNYIHQPYADISGRTVGMMAIAIEVTDQVVARKKLELITDSLPSLISYVNSREQYEFVNSAYEKWFAKSKRDVVGKTLKEVLGDTAYAKVKMHTDNALSGKLDSYESWLDYKDAGRRFISATYVPHLDESKRVVGYFGLVNDLTERKTFEQTISENEERLRLLIEGIGAGTFDYNLLSGAIHWSNDLKQLLGLPIEQSVDADLALSVVHPDDLAMVLQQTADLQAGSKDYMTIDYRIVRKDTKAVRWMHSRSKLLFSNDDRSRPVRMIGFAIDITDRKVAEDRLREFNQKLETEVGERTSELVKANELLINKNDELKNTQSVLQQLIDSSVELIAVVDRNLNFLAVNETFEKFIHKSRADLVGKHIFEAYQGAKGSKQVELLQKALAGERIHLKANPSISKPNDVWFDTHIVPLVVNGKIEGAIALSRDISDIVRSELSLAKVNKQLEEAQRLSKLGVAGSGM